MMVGKGFLPQSGSGELEAKLSYMFPGAGRKGSFGW